MLPPQKKKKKKKKKKVICKSSIIPEASSVPNGSIEEKLKSLGKCPNTTPPKKTTIQYQWKSDESTLTFDFN